MYEPQDQSLALAERDAFRALELDPKNAAAYVILSVCAASLRYAWREAEQLCLSAIRLRPNFLWAHVLLIEHYLFEGKLTQAWQALAHAQSLGAVDDPFPRLPLLRGLLRYFSGAYGAAVSDLTSVVNEHPTYALARFSLAKALLASGEHRLAQAQIDEILRAGYDPLRPGQPSVRERTMALDIIARAAAGDATGAMRARHALEQSANERSISHTCLAVAAMATGDLDGAMQHVYRGIETYDPLTGYAVLDPLLAPLRAHRDWPRVLERMNLVS
jgi:tetratricopeptide (TPR) repeat protein